MQHNVRIKIECQNWAYDLHFAFWNLGSCQVFLLFLYVKFSKIAKNWAEDAITFSVKKKKKKHVPNFEDMENPFCTNSSFTNFLRNVQSRFFIVTFFTLFYVRFLGVFIENGCFSP